jgi:hypothetical protein
MVVLINDRDLATTHYALEGSSREVDGMQLGCDLVLQQYVYPAI